MTTVKEIIEKRGIKEVLHFTTNQGLLGILYTGMIRSRVRLREDESLRHILHLNTERVIDPPQWVDYVNLSLGRINFWLYNFSQNRIRDIDVEWRILSFSTEILEHPGVFFTTVNNGWPACLRNSGGDGLENMFSDFVIGRYNSVTPRFEGMPDDWPTSEQAEALYPEEFSTDYLKAIYVKSEEDLLSVYSQFGATQHPQIEVLVDPSKFGI